MGRKFAFTMVFALLLLGGAECGLRVADMRNGASFRDPIVAKQGRLIYTAHPFLGTTLRPDQQMQMLDGVGRVTVSSNGLRGEAAPIEAPEGVRRVVVHGGSVVFGTGADDADTFPVRMQAALERDTAGAWQVINGGVPGFTSLQSLILYASKTSDYRPDYTVLYQAYNDLKMIAPDFQSDYTHIAIVVGDRGLAYHLFGKLKLYNWLRESRWLRETLLGGKTPVATFWQQVGGQAGATIDSRSTFRRNVTHFVQMAEGMGSRPVLSTFAMPLSEEVLEKWPELGLNIASFIPTLSLDGLRTALAEYNQIIREVAEEHGLLLLDGAQLLSGDGANFIDHCHLSPQGAERLGQAFASLIEADLGVAALGSRR